MVVVTVICAREPREEDVPGQNGMTAALFVVPRSSSFDLVDV
jgi:hypothetical protein